LPLKNGNVADAAVSGNLIAFPQEEGKKQPPNTMLIFVFWGPVVPFNLVPAEVCAVGFCPFHKLAVLFPF